MPYDIDNEKRKKGNLTRFTMPITVGEIDKQRDENDTCVAQPIMSILEKH